MQHSVFQHRATWAAPTATPGAAAAAVAATAPRAPMAPVILTTDKYMAPAKLTIYKMYETPCTQLKKTQY